MKIFVTGKANRLNEIKQKLPAELNCTYNEIKPFTTEANEVALPDLSQFDIIFHLNADDPDFAGVLNDFRNYKGVVIASAVKQNLAEMVAMMDFSPEFGLVGFNALPTFINRNKAEITVYRKTDEVFAEEMFSKLGWEPLVVADRVGMVSPRIVLMIINEACYTLQEGTATAQDIDNSMKLGTNYPFGPLEWADKMDIKNVYECLISLYFDTHDERYKPCPLLKSNYLRGDRFYETNVKA